jgi:hypothetical protein
LDRSIDDVNAGVSLLADEKPDELSHARVVRHREQLLTALKLYSQAAATWRGAVAHASALEFGAAARMIPGMERAAAAFLEACQQVRLCYLFYVEILGVCWLAETCCHIALTCAAPERERSCAMRCPARHLPVAPAGMPAAKRQLALNSTPAVSSLRPRRPAQVDATLHPQRCADRAAPIAPSVLRAIVGGSCAAVALALLLTCGTARRKTKAG